jgi:membrane protein implicated in regulation of membrane protease activity
VLAFVLVVAVFVGLWWLGAQFAPWVAPFLIVPALGFLIYGVARSMRRRQEPPPTSDPT